MTIQGAASRAIEAVAGLVAGGASAQEVAVLTRTRAGGLHRVRIAAERVGVPFTWPLPSGDAVPVHRVREIAELADFLWAADGVLDDGEVREVIEAMPVNSWSKALAGWLGPERRRWNAHRWWTDLQEWTRLERRARTIGHGVHLGTMHSAKGLEFDHVVLLDEGTMADDEDERRLLYVALSRARKSVQIFSTERPSPVFRSLSHPLLSVEPAPPLAGEPLGEHDYALLGPGDIWIDWLGRRDASHLGHGAMARAAQGDAFHLRVEDGRIYVVDDAERVAVTTIARDQREIWASRIERGLRLRLLAAMQERGATREDEYRAKLRQERWWTGVWEARWRADRSAS